MGRGQAPEDQVQGVDESDRLLRHGAADGQPYLFWVTPEDLLEGLPYGWAKPGFYADPGLSEKLSSTEVGVGDSTHEKLRIEVGETLVYAADDEGDVYRIRIFAPEGDLTEITVYVAPQI
jgi:hypothetical protein